MTNNNNRVVFVSQRFPPDKGGNAARINDITTNLDDRWDVTVLAPPPSYPPGEFDRSWQRTQTEKIKNVTVHRLWTWQPQTENPGKVRRLAYYLLFGVHAMIWLLWHVRQYDVVVTTTPPISTGAPGLLAAILAKPWVVDVRDLWIDASISLGYIKADSFIERVSRRFQRLALSTADRITITTESLGDSLQEKYDRSLGSKMVLVPNGVDTDRFRPRTEVTDNTPVEADLDSVKRDGGRPTIIYTGNLGTAQELAACIRAMSHLDNDAVVLRLVGSGDIESDLRELVDEFGLQDRVEFTGVVAREEVPSLLTDATIGIAPLKETDELAYAMPTKVYEYMASGLPTVVTGSGEIEQFVDRSGGGIHVETAPEAIAETFEKLLDDEQLRRLLGMRGREHVEATYDRKQIADRFDTELRSLVEADS